jgi:hypothetical protein
LGCWAPQNISSTAVPAREVYIRSTDDDGSRIPRRFFMAKKISYTLYSSKKPRERISKLQLSNEEIQLFKT